MEMTLKLPHFQEICLEVEATKCSKLNLLYVTYWLLQIIFGKWILKSQKNNANSLTNNCTFYGLQIMINVREKIMRWFDSSSQTDSLNSSHLSNPLQME